MGRTCQMNFHDFYCLNCGQKSMTLPRKKGWQHGAMHRKKLYCPHCKIELNHIEIRNPEEKMKFLEDFKNGVYKDEAEESRIACGDPRQWQKFLATHPSR